MVETTMQEAVAHQLPGLEVTAVKWPQRQLGGNVLQEKYSDARTNDADRNRWLSYPVQFSLLVQIYSPESRLAGLQYYND